MNATKESLDIKVAEIKSLMLEEEEKMKENYKLLHGKVDVIAGAITYLVEFNNEYTKQLQVKSENDEMVFEKMEEFLYGIKETLSKVYISNQSTISQESISKMVMNIELNIKAMMDPILSLVLRLPTNAPRGVQVLQRGDSKVRGAGSSKVPGDDTSFMVGKVISTQIPTIIPMKPIIVSSTTITTKTHVSRVSLKVISIQEGEGRLSKALVKTTSPVDLKDKCKSQRY
ncbi:unnamed protein product [Lactuca saligna]|uniref:Uncharacterized protein n=1 Tax=Lactuca saligna TaxID=75948 RepID=A0AA35ZWV0_LACSI|nr:unnamed protein product [Lactuca saligna]